MLNTLSNRRWRIVAGLMAAGALGACSESTGSGPNSGLSEVEAAELAEVISEDAEAFADASLYDTDHGIRIDVFGPRRDGPGQFFGRLPCQPTPIPADPPNLDGDRVPDALLLDFNGVECSMGGVSVVMSGTLGIEDPAVPGFGIRFIFTNLSKTVSRTDIDASRSVLWNGTRQIVGSPSNPGSQLTHTITNFTTDDLHPRRPPRRRWHRRAWLRSHRRPVAGYPGRYLQLSLRGGLPELHSVSQVWQQQPAPGQTGGRANLEGYIRDAWKLGPIGEEVGRSPSMPNPYIPSAICEFS